MRRNHQTPHWRLACALLFVTALAYFPAWHGEPVWDDQGHLTRPELHGTDGLRRIWTEPGATQQYYPVLHSAFWLEYQLWGYEPVGYHLTNIAQHALSAWLIFLLLGRLKVPGAVAAAAIFALHPVHAESVAWMSEQKNTLSGLFFLWSLLVYLRFDDSRSRRHYGAAMALFALALLSKSVTAVWPAAVVVILWWQRGRVDWKQDLVPLVPFATLAVAAGVTTVLVERWFIGAQGEVFDLELTERMLLAGRVPWFYASSLLWPVGLAFNYPRWVVDVSVWWQWLFPIATIATLAGLWLQQSRLGRGPVTVAALFIVGLGPVLGFVNVYPFQFSFVADHFLYLASIPLIAGVAALVSTQASLPTRTRQIVAAVALLPLAALTWRQSAHYVNEEALYRATLEQNPDSWLAHANLGSLLLLQSTTQHPAALEHARRAVQLHPEHHSVQYTIGQALLANGDAVSAIPHFERAITLHDAIIGAEFQRLQLRRALATALLVQGKGMAQDGRTNDAVTALERAASVAPPTAETYEWLGTAYARSERWTDAVGAYERLLALTGPSAGLHALLGDLKVAAGDVPGAVDHLRKALALDPNHPQATRTLAQLGGR